MITIDFDDRTITVDTEEDRRTVRGWHMSDDPVTLRGQFRIEFDHGDHRSNIGGAGSTNTVYHSGSGGGAAMVRDGRILGGGGGGQGGFVGPVQAYSTITVGGGGKGTDPTIPECPICGAAGGGGHGGGCRNAGKPQQYWVNRDGSPWTVPG
jgi:hypothetical protein